MDHDHLLKVGESVEWTCPKCLNKFLTLITQEDIDDGCRDGVTICFTCVTQLHKETPR